MIQGSIASLDLQTSTERFAWRVRHTPTRHHYIVSVEYRIVPQLDCIFVNLSSVITEADLIKCLEPLYLDHCSRRYVDTCRSSLFCRERNSIAHTPR
jgi:hypothetical protein